jgi:membrane protein DedA with SNARE-associated domain
MNTQRVETWVWVLVYLGMVLIGVGMSVQRSDELLGWVVTVIGITLDTLGVVLIWVRSRAKDEG